jgi:hypothetical protein
VRHRFDRWVLISIPVAILAGSIACAPRSSQQRSVAGVGDTTAEVGVPAPAPVETTTEAGVSPRDAANVVREYYRAIQERRYEDAYRAWVSDGAASGKTLDVFRSGFASTASVQVVVGTPGPIEGAAGSRYIEVPVRLVAVAQDGTRESFTGKYVLRRSVVDGATAEQRTWRIYSAQVRRERPASR